MRILFYDFAFPHVLRDSEYPIGGWAIQLKQIAVALRAAGHAVGVLTLAGANEFVGKQDVIDLVETYDPKAGIRKLRFLSNFPKILAAARRWHPDVIIQSCAGFNTAVMAVVCARLGIPFVHRLANDIDADGRYAEQLSLRERVAFRYGLGRSSLVICQNAYQKSEIERRYPGKPVAIIRNMYLGAPAPAAPLPRDARRYIGWLAVFRKQKNVPLLLRLARALPDIPFRVGGMPAPNMDGEIGAAVEALGKLPNVEMAGYVKRSDVPEFLNHSIALLSTSDFEGFSNAFLESLDCGTPVIARRAIDPDSFLAKNGLGFIADGEDDLAARVREAFALEAGAYDALALACRRYVATEHSPERYVEELVACLSPLTRHRTPKSRA
jgi:glycosyltransferase involved in cell wall biosynthesis